MRDALELLLSESEIICHGPFAGPLDGSKECVPPLIKARDELRAQTGTVKISAPPLDPKRVWQKFEASGGDLRKLNALEIRTLCAADEFATKSVFVQAVRSQPEYLENGRSLYAMVNSYFARWREMERPEELEMVLKDAINRYPRKSPVIERWRTARSLFSAKAAEALAEFVASRQSKIDSVLNLQYVGAATRLAILTRAKTAKLAADRFRRTETSAEETANLASLEWMLQSVLTEAILPGALHYAVSALILSQSAEESETFQQKLRGYVQSHPRLGDPRLRQNMPNWRDMAPDAQQRFLSWLAKENIIFFFDTILPRNNENRRRAEFWLRYHRQITDFQVAISKQDLWKLKANESVTGIPLHSRVTQGSTSAFLMQFKGHGSDYVIAEFSETGNAAYIYDRQTFESTNINLRTPEFQRNRHLSHDGRLDRILHFAGWEVSARETLARLGIRP